MRIEKIIAGEILFDNGLTIRDFHDQECCESVYADFKALLDTPAMNFEFSETPQIEMVIDSGIKIDGWFVPCYSKQNGYYSSDLTLHVGDSRILDISPGVEFQYE